MKVVTKSEEKRNGKGGREGKEKRRYADIGSQIINF